MPNFLMSPITQGIGGGTIASAGALGNVQGFQNPMRSQLSTSLLSGMQDKPGMNIGGSAGGQFMMNGVRTDSPFSHQSLMAQGPAQQQAYQQYQAAGGAAQNYNPYVESANSTGSQIGTMGGQYLGGQLQGVAAKNKTIAGMSQQDWTLNPSLRMNQQTGQQEVWQPNNAMGWQPQYGYKMNKDGEMGNHVQRLGRPQGMAMGVDQYMQQHGLNSINSYNYQGPTNSFQNGMGSSQPRSMGQPSQGMGIMPTNTNQSLAQGLRTV